MAKLEYTFKNDTLFKMLFVNNPDLLKKLVAELLNTQLESIRQFEITNPEMPPEIIGSKFCRLDINMTLDGQQVDLELQVGDEGNFPERSLYYWAREYSTSLEKGKNYSALPRTIIISIIGFNLFDCIEFHSEFQALEVTRHTLLTDKICLHYFELPKLPKEVAKDDELKLWLALFNAETEEDLNKIEGMEVPVMEQAIDAYRKVTASNEFKEIERQRVYSLLNETYALNHAQEVERAKWQGVVAEKDAALVEKDAALAENKAALAEKDAALAEKDALITELKARFGVEKQ